jgi:hypothetical protein
MFLIADLERPQEGLLEVSQQAMVDLRNSLDAMKPLRRDLLALWNRCSALNSLLRL